MELPISKNEINKNNDYSRIVFNAAQTEATKAKFRERKDVTTYQTSTNATEKANALKNIYFGGHASGDFYFYWDGTTGHQMDSANPNVISDTNVQENAHLATAINNICGTEGVYKIFVNNYNVQSVVFCSQQNGQYKGTYPRTMGSEQISNENAIRNNAVSAVDAAAMNAVAIAPIPVTPEPAEGT